MYVKFDNTAFRKVITNQESLNLMKMNPILLQKHLKENAADLQVFCNELKDWGEDMKRKEEDLKRNKQSSSNKIRKISGNFTDQHTNIVKPPVKVGYTNYAAWDKFDADAECEKIETENSNEESELTDEFDDNSIDEAVVQKEKGNKFVKCQKWKEAIQCYTKAIGLHRYDPVFYANRALCHLKLNDMDKTEFDCTAALKLDKTYVKAYQRRAYAREKLNKLDGAFSDLSKVLEFEPKNMDSRASWERIRKKLDECVRTCDIGPRPVSKFTASRSKTNANSNLIETCMESTKMNDNARMLDTGRPDQPFVIPNDDRIIVKAVKKPPHLRSKKPLKYIEISESCTIEKSKDHTICEENAVKDYVIERHEKQEMSFENDVSMIALPKPTETFIMESSKLQIVEHKNAESLEKDIKNNSNSSLVFDKRKSKGKLPNDINECTAPETCVQFYSAWKAMRSNIDKYNYLKSIDPSKIPKIFQESLESNALSSLLQVLAKHFVENNQPVFEYLWYITEVKRFSALTMFMSSTDKNCLWKLFDYIRDAEKKSIEDIDDLIKKYEL